MTSIRGGYPSPPSDGTSKPLKLPTGPAEGRRAVADQKTASIPDFITQQQVMDALKVLGLDGIENPLRLDVDIRQLRITWRPDGHNAYVESYAVIPVIPKRAEEPHNAA